MFGSGMTPGGYAILYPADVRIVLRRNALAFPKNFSIGYKVQVKKAKL